MRHARKGCCKCAGVSSCVRAVHMMYQSEQTTVDSNANKCRRAANVCHFFPRWKVQPGPGAKNSLVGGAGGRWQISSCAERETPPVFAAGQVVHLSLPRAQLRALRTCRVLPLCYLLACPGSSRPHRALDPQWRSARPADGRLDGSGRRRASGSCLWGLYSSPDMQTRRRAWPGLWSHQSTIWPTY